ncbi:MAG TPA: chorismate-binding protein, partial [Oscillatoriaceae cyanobacterium]
RAPRSHRFCFRFGAESFLGASPELIFAQTGDRVYADCLAGTTARGATPAEDDALGQALLSNEKERREHAAVVTMVRGVLGPLTDTLSLPEVPALRVLPNVQHLHTPVEGRLKPKTDLTALLTGLHPTPAVCGTPREAARAFIQEVEGFARGWYAGAIGWVGLDEAQFAVGIRSALLREREALVFAGAGLVVGSEPASEWLETERKAAPLVGLLTGAGA